MFLNTAYNLYLYNVHIVQTVFSKTIYKRCILKYLYIHAFNSVYISYTQNIGNAYIEELTPAVPESTHILYSMYSGVFVFHCYYADKISGCCCIREDPVIAHGNRSPHSTTVYSHMTAEM
jgi:hypothetical protein